ncbi:MAG: metal ABC transporter ATP-binding protein [Candidatus Anstonellales archaeon]
MNHNPILIFENVHFKYSNFEVLENISFKINKGEFIAILGHNGAGKTTLMKLALNLLKPTKGKIIWNFNKDKISYVQQNLNDIEFSFPANVEEVVELGIKNQKNLSQKEIGSKVENALKLLKIDDLKKRLIGKLSIGQLQRVFLAKALISDPEILFLDEPTSAMDLQSQIEFYSLLKKLNKENKLTIILISHDIGQILKYVDRVIVLNKTIVYEGLTKDFDANSFFKLTEKI